MYEGLSHGFFNTGFIVEESKKTIVNSVAHWKKLMQQD